MKARAGFAIKLTQPDETNEIYNHTSEKSMAEKGKADEQLFHLLSNLLQQVWLASCVFQHLQRFNFGPMHYDCGFDSCIFNMMYDSLMRVLKKRGGLSCGYRQ